MWKRLLYVGSILVGAAGFCSIPFIVGVGDLARVIGQVGWLMLALFVVNAALVLVAPGVSWWLLMRAEGIPATLGQTLRANFMGFPLNFITPSMYLGSEPLRTVYIARVCGVTKRRVLATIIVSKFQEFGGLVLGMILATALVITKQTREHQILLVVSMGFLLLCLVGTLAAFAGRFRPTVKAIEFLSRFRPFRRRMARIRRFAIEMEDLIHAAFTKRVGTFLLTQGITLVSMVSVFLRPVIFFRAIHQELPLDKVSLVFLVTNLVNGFTPIPGGLGLSEVAMTGLMGAAGPGDHVGAAYAIVNRISDLVLIVFGTWLIVHYGMSRIASGSETALTPEDQAGLPTTATLRVEPPSDPQ